MDYFMLPPQIPQTVQMPLGVPSLVRISGVREIVSHSVVNYSGQKRKCENYNEVEDENCNNEYGMIANTSKNPRCTLNENMNVVIPDLSVLNLNDDNVNDV